MRSEAEPEERELPELVTARRFRIRHVPFVALILLIGVVEGAEFLERNSASRAMAGAASFSGHLGELVVEYGSAEALTDDLAGKAVMLDGFLLFDHRSSANPYLLIGRDPKDEYHLTCFLEDSEEIYIPKLWKGKEVKIHGILEIVNNVGVLRYSRIIE